MLGVTIKILMFKSMGYLTLKLLKVVHLLMVSNPRVRQEKVEVGRTVDESHRQ